MSIGSRVALTAAGAALLAVLGLPTVEAQQAAPSVKRTVLQKQGLHTPGQDGVMAFVEIPVGGREGRHTHPADVFGYVIDGTLTFDIEGKPTATYKAGDSFFVEAGRVHEGTNNGTTPVKVVAVFFADAGKPLTSPAPAK